MDAGRALVAIVGVNATRCLHVTILLELLLRCSLAAGEPHSGPVDQRVRCDLVLDKEIYEVGEPIEVTIRLTNVGTAPVEVDESSETTGRIDGYSLLVQTAEGESLRDPMYEYIGLMHSLGSVRSIEPGASCSRKLMLNHRVPCLKPDKYSVRGIWQPIRHRGILKAESQGVAFQIVDTPPGVVQKRVTRLREDLRNGAEAKEVAPLLGFTGHSEAIPSLIDLLYRDNDGTEVAAAQALLYLDRDSAKRALLASLRDRGPRHRMVHLLIVPMGAPQAEVIPVLERWLEVKDDETRYGAVEGLYLANRDHNPNLLPRLAARLTDPVPKVRMSAAAAIGGYRNASALKILKRAVGDPDLTVREQATIAVGWIGMAAAANSAVRKEAVDTLLAQLRSRRSAARQAAYWLGRMADKRAIAEMKKVLQNTNDLKLRDELQKGLKNMGV